MDEIDEIQEVRKNMANISRAYQIGLVGLIGIATMQIGTVAAEPVLRPTCNVSVQTYSSPKRASVPAGTTFYTCPDEKSEVDRQIKIPANVRLVGEVGDWYEYEFRAGSPVYARNPGAASKGDTGTSTASGSATTSAATVPATSRASEASATGRVGEELLPVPNLPNADVAGVRLGGSLEEAKAAIRKANPALSFTSYTYDLARDECASRTGPQGNKALCLVARGIVATTTARDDEFVVFADQIGRVWYVSRKKTLKEGPRFEVSEFIETARRKYGPESNKIGSIGLAWYFDANGNLVKTRAGMIPPCQAMYSGTFVWKKGSEEKGMMDEESSLWIHHVEPTCGRYISVTAGGNNRDGLSDSYSVVLMDAIVGLNFTASERSRLRREHEQKVEEEKAKSRKIEL